jgi:predicted HicB family RNase H-like nuclease
MKKEGRYSELLKLRIEPDLLQRAQERAEGLGVDLSTFVRWCIMTGLFLPDLNTFVRSKMGEDK